MTGFIVTALIGSPYTCSMFNSVIARFHSKQHRTSIPIYSRFKHFLYKINSRFRRYIQFSPIVSWQMDDLTRQVSCRYPAPLLSLDNTKHTSKYQSGRVCLHPGLLQKTRDRVKVCGARLTPTVSSVTGTRSVSVPPCVTRNLTNRYVSLSYCIVCVFGICQLCRLEPLHVYTAVSVVGNNMFIALT